MRFYILLDLLVPLVLLAWLYLFVSSASSKPKPPLDPPKVKATPTIDAETKKKRDGFPGRRQGGGTWNTDEEEDEDWRQG